LLKNLPDEAIAYLTHIINSILKLTHFPQCWKSAKVVYLPKPGKDPKYPQNYRPISSTNRRPGRGGQPPGAPNFSEVQRAPNSLL